MLPDDVSHVEPRFRRLACMLEVFLLGGLLFFAAGSIVYVLATVEDPPVMFSRQHWQGVSKWMLCPVSPHENISAVGLDLRQSGGHQGYKEPVEIFFDTQFTAYGYGVCVVVDLTAFDVQDPPLNFNLCHDAPDRVKFYVWSRDRWAWANLEQGRHSASRLRLQMHKEGFNNGLWTHQEDVFTLGWYDDRSQNDGYFRYGNHWTSCDEWFPLNSSDTHREQLASYVAIYITEPYVSVEIQQGILPRIFTMLSRIGGYITIVTLIFTRIFVRRYPTSLVAMTYDARTLYGYEIVGEPRVEACQEDRITLPNTFGTSTMLSL